MRSGACSGPGLPGRTSSACFISEAALINPSISDRMACRPDRRRRASSAGAVQPVGTDVKGGPFRHVHVLDGHVEVDLLRVRRIRPARRGVLLSGRPGGQACSPQLEISASPSNCPAIRGTAVPIGSLITSAARPSYGVASALTITSAAPAASPHSDAAGSTVSVDPIARNRSQLPRGLLRPEEDPGVEPLAEHDRRGLQYPAAPCAVRVLLARVDPGQRTRHRRAVATATRTPRRTWCRATRSPAPRACPPSDAARRCSA